MSEPSTVGQLWRSKRPNIQLGNLWNKSSKPELFGIFGRIPRVSIPTFWRNSLLKGGLVQVVIIYQTSKGLPQKRLDLSPTWWQWRSWRRAATQWICWPLAPLVALSNQESKARFSWRNAEKHIQEMGYPLVNDHIAIEYHYFQSEIHLQKSPCSIVMLVYRSVISKLLGLLGGIGESSSGI